MLTVWMLAADEPPPDFWRHPITIAVVVALLGLLVEMVRRVLDRQKANAAAMLAQQKEATAAQKEATAAINEMSERVVRLETGLLTHMQREDEINDDTETDIRELREGQATGQREMRKAVDSLRKDAASAVRGVHERLDLVLAGAPEARPGLWRQRRSGEDPLLASVTEAPLDED